MERIYQTNPIKFAVHLTDLMSHNNRPDKAEIVS